MILLRVMMAAIFFRAILSWFRLDPYNPLVQMLNQITDPILDPLRRVVPRMGMMDLTPMAAIFLLWFLSQAVSRGL